MAPQQSRVSIPDPETDDNDDDVLDASDADEEIALDDDQPMEDDDENDSDAENNASEEIQLQNDSAAHFDSHTDSIFTIARHPLNRNLIITGGGDDVAYIFDSSLSKIKGEPEEDRDPNPPFPESYESAPRPQQSSARESIAPLQRLGGHTDSVNAVAFTLPRGEYVATAGLDGKLRVWTSSSSASPSSTSLTPYAFLAESSEVKEINWLSACPSPSHPNVLALGASDGSVWIYTLNASDLSSPLGITQVYYLHTESCTAGAWTPDGSLLATVSEDSSLHVFDVWGEAASAINSKPTGQGQALISLAATDQRFAVEGGLYSLAISPGGGLVAVGGAGGNIRIVSLPRLKSSITTSTSSTSSISTSKPNPKSKNKSTPNPSSTSTTGGSGSGSADFGTLLASLTSQNDGIETLSFSPSPFPLLASGSVDGSIHIFDVAHRFVLKRALAEAHEGYAVVKVEFSQAGRGESYHLTSAGMDGVLRRWDLRGSTTGSGSGSGSGSSSIPASASAPSANSSSRGLVKEWKGHRGEGEGGGILGFVQGGVIDGVEGGEQIVTAGDDGVALVFRG